MKNLILSCIESRVENSQTLYGCFKIGPFYINQGLTIANTLRRVLLSNLEGLSIGFIQIEGVKHEYSIIKGIQESVLEILTNLKNIQFKTNRIFYKPQIAYLNIKGPKIVYSNDIQLPNYIQNIDLSKYIATIAVGGQLKMKIFICQGRRYVLNNSLKTVIHKKYKKILNLKAQNYLFLDTIFLPVQKVNFTLEENPNLGNEFIIMEIWTNGGIHPKQSLYKAINEIIQLLVPFRRLKSLNPLKSSFMLQKQSKILEKPDQTILNKINSVQFHKKLASLDISNLNFKLSTYSYLKKIKVNTISDLLNKPKKDLFSLKSFTLDIYNDIETNLSIFGLKIK
nr:RNA polymerase alpha subunit [Ostreobium quekettii]